MKRRLLLSPVLIAIVAACGSAPETGNDAREPAQNQAPAPPPSQEIAANDSGESIASNAAAPKQASASERRCGWLQNPTPGNWWLVDRDGEWLLGAQGGYQAPGMDDMPDMSAVDWAAVNGNYGYGCACLDVVVDPASHKVVKLVSATPKPLAICRADRKLPKPDAD
jgi:hypothetical protein